MVRVLVVEDDARLNQIVCASLRAAGYEAIGCANAAQATDALHGDGADIIISDIMMPGVDGFEFVSEVRSVNRHIPILLMTALDDMSAKRKGFGAGIDDYMVKPIDVDELLLRIEALLRRAHAAIKFPIKVQLCRTFIPLLRDTCPEPSLPCKDEGDIRKSFLGNFFGI